MRDEIRILRNWLRHKIEELECQREGTDSGSKRKAIRNTKPVKKPGEQSEHIPEETTENWSCNLQGKMD
jgi:hypothetical protein